MQQIFMRLVLVLTAELRGVTQSFNNGAAWQLKLCVTLRNSAVNNTELTALPHNNLNSSIKL